MENIGYSGTPLAQKLGIKSGFTIKLINQPHYYFDLFEEFPQNCIFSDDNSCTKDLIHAFVIEVDELESLIYFLKKEIKPNGAIWVSWYKKSAKMNSKITEDIIRKLAIEIGLVDVKVCAVDEKWSALKLVIPLKNRKT
jgi:hypothetical protein